MFAELDMDTDRRNSQIINATRLQEKETEVTPHQIEMKTTHRSKPTWTPWTSKTQTMRWAEITFEPDESMRHGGGLQDADLGEDEHESGRLHP